MYHRSIEKKRRHAPGHLTEQLPSTLAKVTSILGFFLSDNLNTVTVTITRKEFMT